jgi:hypothetical protein
MNVFQVRGTTFISTVNETVTYTEKVMPITTDQGCQIFLGPKYPKRGKIYQITTKYTK